MIKFKLDNLQKIKLQKGNKIIERPFSDYQTNKNVWEFRGFKPIQDVVKEDKVVELKPKKRKTRKKKDERMDLETD
jgi:hypothetical protein|tara:strand:+ start:55 stop:282 length:228 start_codon:yes stop_codon:yes gene_type:complete